MSSFPHLARHQRMILLRSLAATASSLVPVPFLDDWGKDKILGTAYRQIAAARQVVIDDAALDLLIDGKRDRGLREAAMLGLVTKAARRLWLSALLAISTVIRARQISDRYVFLMLFAHYCESLPQGSTITEPMARALFATMKAAEKQARGSLMGAPVRRALGAAWSATSRATARATELVRRRSSAGPDKSDERPIIERAIAEAEAGQRNFLSRAAAELAQPLSADANPFLRDALARFDTLWRSQAK